jgi:hypothetical protein
LEIFTKEKIGARKSCGRLFIYRELSEFGEPNFSGGGREWKKLKFKE